MHFPKFSTFHPYRTSPQNPHSETPRFPWDHRGCIVAQQIGSPNEASKRQPLSRKKRGHFAAAKWGMGRVLLQRNADLSRFPRGWGERIRSAFFFCKTSWNFLRRWRNFARLRKIIRQFKKQKQGTWHTKNRDMTCLVTFGHVRLDDRIIAYARIKRLGRQLNTQSEQPSKHYWFSATSSSWHLRQVLARMRSLCNGATSILP